jgi:ketosteroid isomerase-like protein
VSEQNVELHRRLVEAFNTRDIEAWIALCDPSIEFHTMMGVGNAVYYGHDGMRSWHRDLEEAWGDELRIEPEAYFDLGERTIAFNLLHGRGHHSGADVEMAYAQMVRWRDGLMVYFNAYAHREDALRDLGVSEDALEPIAP